MRKNAFNLIDVLMAMIVVGVIFTLTIPVLNKNTSGKELATSLSNFNTELQAIIDSWKVDNNCIYKVDKCLDIQKTMLQVQPDFNQFKKYMKIVEEVEQSPSDEPWLPPETLNYYGTAQSQYDFRTCPNRSIYLLLDGTILSVQKDSNGLWLVVDVNGKRPPNRIGKDTFHMTIGYNTGNDINYYARDLTEDGICGHGINGQIKCDPENVNPAVDNGASPTAYTIINGKLPDFEELSKSVPNFKL